jgi:phosphoglycolate phosphatase
MGRVLLLDLDGTLVDSRRDIAGAGNAARATVGLPPLPVEAVVPMVGDGAAALIERLTPSCDDAARDRAMSAFRSAYAGSLVEHTKPYAGIPELLARVRAAGWLLAVATNKPAVFARPILERLALPFDALRGGEGAKKPDPAMLHELLHELGGAAADAWMAGDHRTDIAAAQAAGVRSVHCAWGFGRLEGLRPDATARTPADLGALIGLPR